MGRALQDAIVSYLRSRARPILVATMGRALALPMTMVRRELRRLVTAGRVRRTAAGRYGVPSQRRRRECLGCDRQFMSDGPHNRLCASCAERDDPTPPARRVHIGDSKHYEE